MSSPSIRGFGVLYYDLVFKSGKSSNLVFLGGRAGGSTANFLSNCADEGCNSTFHGLAGEDFFGTSARRDLESSGVNISGRVLMPKKATRIIFEHLGNPDELQIGVDQHRFSVQCPVCKRDEGSGVMKSLPTSFFESNFPIVDGDVCYFDSISIGRARAIDEMRRSATLFAVADIGRLGSLRYMVDQEVLAVLRKMDGIFCSTLVARSLLKRCGCSDYLELLKLTGLAFIIVSAGPDGVDAHFSPGHSKFYSTKLAAPKGKIVDAAGAGDAFFAGLIAHLSKLSPSGIQRHSLVPEIFHDALVSGRSAAHKTLQTIGARGHLGDGALEELGRYAPFVDQCGNSVSSLLQKYDQLESCPFCLRESQVLKEKKETDSSRKMKVYRRNIGVLLARMDDVGRGSSEVSAGELMNDSKTAVVIGTGGSFPVARYLTDLLSIKSSAFVCAMHPMQYVRTPRICDTIIVISYSGNTADCEAAAITALRVGVRRIVLVTGNANGSISKILRDSDSIVAYEEGPLEKGFVSIRGTVLPCSWFLKSYIENRDYFELLTWLHECCVINPISAFRQIREKVLERIRRKCSISYELYGSGYAIPALEDFESKIAESGAGFARMHESKDFSHGRFMSVMKLGDQKCDSLGIIFSVGQVSGYEKKMAQALSDYQDVITVESRYGGPIGGLELLVIVQYVVRILGDCFKQDFSRPGNIPSAGLGLYRWKGTLE